MKIGFVLSRRVSSRKALSCTGDPFVLSGCLLVNRFLMRPNEGRAMVSVSGGAVVEEQINTLSEVCVMRSES
jgi:hypothetical protein